MIQGCLLQGGNRFHPFGASAIVEGWAVRSP